jgi:predicted ABC-type ATPase
MPVLHLIAGPNGAGKSTLYQYLIAPRYPALEFVNADEHERQVLHHIANPVQRSLAARNWADARRAALLTEGVSFVSETVFSHPSKIALIQQAQASGFRVLLYVLCLDEPRLLLKRVRQRVKEGGHAVPSNKILERYPRTVANLEQAVRLADMSMLFDAQDTHLGGPRLLVICSKGTTELHVSALPRWAREVLGDRIHHPRASA